MQRTGLLWVIERSTVFSSSYPGFVDKIDILRSAEDTIICGGFVASSGVTQGVVVGVICTARMFEGESRELMGSGCDGAVIASSVGRMKSQQHDGFLPCHLRLGSLVSTSSACGNNPSMLVSHIILRLVFMIDDSPYLKTEKKDQVHTMQPQENTTRTRTSQDPKLEHLTWQSPPLLPLLPRGLLIHDTGIVLSLLLENLLDRPIPCSSGCPGIGGQPCLAQECIKRLKCVSECRMPRSQEGGYLVVVV